MEKVITINDWWDGSLLGLAATGDIFTDNSVDKGQEAIIHNFDKQSN